MSNTNEFISVIRKNWLWVLLVTVVAVATAVMTTYRQTPLYISSVTIAVAPNSKITGPREILRSLETLERRTIIATFSKILSKSNIREQVAKQLKIEPRMARRYYISGTVLPNTNLIRIDVKGPDPKLVAAVANTAAGAVRDRVRSMYKIFNLIKLHDADIPRRPANKTMARSVLVATIAGIFIGILLVLAREKWFSMKTDKSSA